MADEPEREKLARDDPERDVDMLLLWVQVQELELRGLLDSMGIDPEATHPGTFAELDKARTRLHWPWN